MLPQPKHEAVASPLGGGAKFKQFGEESPYQPGTEYLDLDILESFSL